MTMQMLMCNGQPASGGGRVGGQLKIIKNTKFKIQNL